MVEMKLPPYATRVEINNPKFRGAVVIDTRAAFPAMLAELGLEKNRYGVEVAYQCIKLDVQAALRGTDLDLSVHGEPVVLQFTNAPEWALANLPGSNEDVSRATKGLEAREHYIRLRGSLPY